MQPSGSDLAIPGWLAWPCSPGNVAKVTHLGPDVVGVPRKKLTPLHFRWIEVGLVLPNFLLLQLGCSSRGLRGKGNELNPSLDTFVLILSLSCCLLTGDGWLIMRPAQYITFPIQGLLNHFKFSNSLINILSVAEESGTDPFLKR